MTNTRQNYVNMVSRPGKFEQENPYVPYYWEQFLNGGADEDDGEILSFDVTSEDKILFPELKNRRTVNIYETDTGFITEVQ